MGTTALVASALVGTGYSIYSGERADSRMKSANEQAIKQATDQERKAQEAMNRSNPKRPNFNTLLSQVSKGGGIAGTMLTGPAGVGNNTLPLGGSTLLGQ